MPDTVPPPVDTPLWLGLLIACAATGCLMATVGVWPLFFRGVLPRYQPRRHVPWGLSDLLVVLVFYILVQVVTYRAISWILGPTSTQPVAEEVAPEAMHPLLDLLTQQDSIAVLALAVIAAVFAAAMVEEFLFRLVLQGWLESCERRYRKYLPVARQVRRFLPVLISSGLFAAMHFRPATNPPTEVIVQGMGAMTIGSFLTLAAGWTWLRMVRGASFEDLGCSLRHLPTDFGLGLLFFLSLLVPILATKVVLLQFVPSMRFVDPAAIFILALGLGALYQRTHRLAPSIAMHMSLNASSLIAVWVM